MYPACAPPSSLRPGPEAGSPHARWIERCRKGDPLAQRWVYQQYKKAMYRVALRIVGNEWEAEDILQEAFVKAFSKLHLYREEATFGAWLKRIVVNLSLNHVKRRKLDTVGLEAVRAAELSEESEGQSRSLATLLAVRRAMKALPSGYRQVMELYLLEGYDHEEIGKILHISEATSKSQYCRARQRLRHILGVSADE